VSYAYSIDSIKKALEHIDRFVQKAAGERKKWQQG